MDLQVKSWLEKAKRLNFSVWVMLRLDSSDEFGESAKLHVLICKIDEFGSPFFRNLLIVRWICPKEKNGDEKYSLGLLCTTMLTVT